MMKVLKKSRPALLLLSVLPLLQACEKPATVVRFSAQVGEQPLRCDTRYANIGKSGTPIELIDFRLYVRDVTLVRANGEKHPLILEQDGTWQVDSIALLDFADGTGTCEAGSPATRLEVVGEAPDFDDYTGLEFKLGVPEDQNHLNGSTRPPPLNSTDMYWSWQGGYKFVSLDVRTPQHDAWVFHLGASDCKGSPGEGYSCAANNQATVTLNGFNPKSNQVVLDLAGLLSDSDLNHVIDNKTDYIAGCMSGRTDPECPALYEKVGLAADGTPQAVPASFIRVR
ncbi:metallo-mystery pair system four-Cys motif protein [Archangium violaceum]|uniref:MbnP family copper-binding protein n=1 Tax=Archangium violaceum TaxID=83451 RepID=UPI002B2A2F87|nr:metallo-mystery pair system four-Cys motif protein [Archangium violaceum]